MKPFLIWLAIVAVVFGVFAAVTVVTRDTTRIFVYVDASNPMVPVWADARRELDRIDDRDDSEFALAFGRRNTNELAHSWQGSLALPGDVLPFGPCVLDAAGTIPEASEADERILITVADSCDRDAFVDWQIVELD